MLIQIHLNLSTNIYFSVSERTQLSLKVYDVTGKIIETLINNEYKEPGNHSIIYNADQLSSGLYILQLDVPHKKSVTYKVTLIK